MKRSSERLRGFTFIEVLAAMLFMAIVIPVATEGLLLANRVSQRAVRKQQAVELADQLLGELVATDDWRNGDQSGSWDEDWPGYEWRYTSEPWPEDVMRLITVTVSYTVQGRTFEESLSTLAWEYEKEDAATETEL